MRLEIEFTGFIAEKLGVRTLTSDSISNMQQLESELQLKFPLLKTCSYNIFINNKIANPTGFLTNNDKVYIMPLFSGG